MPQLLPSPTSLTGWLRVACLAAALVATVAPAAAADDAPARTASVERLVEVMRAEATIGSVMSGMDRNLVDSARQQGLGEADMVIVEKYAREVGDIMRREMQWDQFKLSMVDIYAKLFTEHEVQGMIRFYESDVGQSMVSKTPRLAQETTALTQAILARSMPRVQALVAQMQREIAQRQSTEKAN